MLLEVEQGTEGHKPRREPKQHSRQNMPAEPAFPLAPGPPADTALASA